MDNQHRKCSSKKHKELNANSYCQECRLYMCEECKKNHLDLYEHNYLNLNENQNDIFTGICKEENHNYNLDLYCKTHNKLCCLACITKINKKGYGQHSECDICIIEEIKEEKKEELNKNIEEFENLSNSVNQSIDKLKIIFEEINKNKEDMKLKIQKIFTQLRNELNNREDELLLKIDKKFKDVFIKEDSIKNFEKLPKQIKELLEDINAINKEWDNEHLNFYLNNCSKIENNIKNIKANNNNLQNCISSRIYNIDFSPKEYELNEMVEKIRTFGEIYYEYEFGKFGKKIEELPEYEISGEKENIITKKINNKKWIRILGKNILEKQKEYNFKIKILNSKSSQIMIGIAQTFPKAQNSKIIKDYINSTTNIVNKINPYNPYNYNRNINKIESKNDNIIKKECLIYYLNNELEKDLIFNYGWYIYIPKLTLFSDSPQNYRNKEINLGITNEIKFNINMKNGSFNLIFGNNEKNELYNNIPLEIPISLSILLYDENDSIEIIPF